jgi:hypothetical protein
MCAMIRRELARVAETELCEAAGTLGPDKGCVSRGCGCLNREEVLDNKLPFYDC